MAYKPPPEPKTEWKPVGDMPGASIAELHGPELARGRLYFAGVTHCLRWPSCPVRFGPKLTVDGVGFEVGFSLPDSSGQMVDVFLKLAEPIPDQRS